MLNTVFPRGAHVVTAHPHGASFWTKTTRIDVELEDGSTRSYFLKASLNDLGKAMALSEFDGTAAVHKYVPEFVPRPVGWGQYKSDPNVYFYMCEYVNMINELPEVSSFCKILAELHKKSMPDSNGKFGYHITTYGGTMPQYVKWSDTWEEFYIENLKDFARQERETHGPSDELNAMFPALFEKVCPRLLRPLERGPNKIKPVLIHGDIWYGNLSTNADTGNAITFDPSVLWAHNECEPLSTVRPCADFLLTHVKMSFLS
jgi:protein-ribulosamine 3-kinase